MKTICTTLFFILFYTFSFAQCNLSTINNTIYNTKTECSGAKMVISIDNTISISENCGNIRFTPVLTSLKKPTSVNETINDFSINIFPMPFVDMIYIDLRNTHYKYTADIFDLLGRLVYSSLELFPDEINHFNLNLLEPGSYFIVLKSKEAQSKSLKLIKI